MATLLLLEYLARASTCTRPYPIGDAYLLTDTAALQTRACGCNARQQI